MEAILSNKISKEIVKNSVFDILAIAGIYLVPVLSHLTALPIYYIEPMRLMLILAIVHTSKKNAYILAATLPIFSFVISAHPVFLKTLLITGELLLMTWIFYFLSEKINNKFSSMIFSIGISKTFYYVIKFALLSAVLIEGSLISTPIFMQVLTTILFSSYIFLIKK
ncbi:MAG: hypothetical protein H6611_06935 [Ignavibacteriales bacterium]|nr:hypothetical protein [Ignavibacteriales bacterium]MCB9207775.1 hypothetical protein [Ignavibacteriales bacterium]